jgi:hypothetical protein
LYRSITFFASDEQNLVELGVDSFLNKNSSYLKYVKDLQNVGVTLPLHITAMAETRTVDVDGYAVYRKLIPKEVVQRARNSFGKKIEEWRKSAGDGKIYDVVFEWQHWPPECEDLCKTLIVSCSGKVAMPNAYLHRIN